MPKYNTNRSFNDTSPASGRKEKVKIDDSVDILKLKKQKYMTLRLVGPVFSTCVHWIEIKTKEGKNVKIPKLCLRYEAETDTIDTTKECPYCEKLSSKDKASQRYYVNAIVRSIEESKPSKFHKKYSKSEKKTGFKEAIDSEAWTPVRVFSVPAGVGGKLKGLADLNKHKVDGKTKAMPISDEEYGMDIDVKFDPDAKSASAMYDIQKGEKTSLDEEQQSYLHWNLEPVLEAFNDSLKEDLKTAKEECKKLLKTVVNKPDDNDAEYSDEGDSKMAGKGKGKKGKKVEDSEMSETSAEESSAEESSEDSDAKPAKGKGKAAKGKKGKKEESSEESSENSENSEESSDAKPAKGKGKKGKKEDSDELSSEDSDAENSEESSEDSDAKPAKGKKGAKGAKGGKAAKGKKGKKEDSDEDSEESSEESSEDSD